MQNEEKRTDSQSGERERNTREPEHRPQSATKGMEYQTTKVVPIFVLQAVVEFILTYIFFNMMLE